MPSDPDPLPQTSGVYRIYSAINGRTYIGSAKNFRARWYTHQAALRSRNKKRCSPHLQNAWDLYGPEEFEFTIVEECPVDQLLIREQVYLDLIFASLPEPYNICRTAGSRLGTTHTDETRARMSESHTGLKDSDETRAKKSVAMLGNQYGVGHAVSAEHRAIISEASKGKTISLEHRARISEAQKGNKYCVGREMSEETRKRIGDANRGNTHTEETKARMSETRKGRTHTEESKAKMSESAKAAWARRKAEKESDG